MDDSPHPQPPWHLLDVLFAGSVLSLFAASGLFSIIKPPALAPFPGLRPLLPSLLITPAIAFLLLFCRAALTRAPLSAFLGRPSARSLGQGLLFGLLAFPFLSLIGYAVFTLASHFGLPAPLQNSARWLLSGEISTPAQLFLCLHITLLAPLAEELLFRGVLLSAFARIRRPALGIALTSLLFGLCHAHLLALLPTALLGALLAFLSLRCHSLFPGIACHITFNLANLLLLYLFPSSISSSL